MYVQRVSCKRSGEYTWKKKLSFFNVRAVNVRWIELTLSSAFVVPIFFGCIICCFSIYFSISFFHPKLLQMIDSFARSFIPSFAQTNLFFLLCIAIELVFLPLQMISGNAVFFFLSLVWIKKCQPITTNTSSSEIPNLFWHYLKRQTFPYHLFGEVFSCVACLLACY